MKLHFQGIPRSLPLYTFISRAALPVILLSATVVFSACATSRSLRLFYRPEGSAVEIYKENPVNLRLVVYPAPHGPIRGAVLFIHGGAWKAGGADIPFYSDWEPILKKRHLRSFSVEYRTTPQWRGMDPVQDCMDAVRYVRDNAERFGIPPDKIALVGFSAGGHLAVLSAEILTDGAKVPPKTPEGERRGPAENPENWEGTARAIRSVVSFYGPMEPLSLVNDPSPEVRRIMHEYLPELPANGSDQGAQGTVPPEWLALSPLDNIHRGMPPVLLIHGERDRLVPISQSIHFLKRARALGITDVHLIPLKRGDHNFDRSRSKWAHDALVEAADFILLHMSH